MTIYSPFRIALEYIRTYNKDNENVRFIEKERKDMSKQAKTLTKADVRKVLDYIAVRKHSLRNKTAFLMLYYTGMRVSELASLKIGDLLAQDGRVKSEFLLKAENTKTNDARTIYINEKLMKVITEYLKSLDTTNKESSLLSTQKDKLGGFSANSLCQYFHYLYKNAGISGASSHSGRRTFITELANKGVGARVLMALSGHKSMAVLQQYIDVNDDIKRNSVALL